MSETSSLVCAFCGEGITLKRPPANVDESGYITSNYENPPIHYFHVSCHVEMVKKEQWVSTVTIPYCYIHKLKNEVIPK